MHDSCLVFKAQDLIKLLGSSALLPVAFIKSMYFLGKLKSHYVCVCVCVCVCVYTPLVVSRFSFHLGLEQ